MGQLLIGVLAILSLYIHAQRPDIRVNPINTTFPDTSAKKNTALIIKPEIFSSGFIDIINNGQVNAAARFVRIFIGEPGKFTVPLSIYSCVNSNSFDRLPVIPGSALNDHLPNSLINPLSGIVNVSVNGFLHLRRKQHKLTKSGLLYHGGTRVLSGYRSSLITDPDYGSSIQFLSSFGTVGLYVQTGAWERSATGNLGVFWSALRYIAVLSDEKKLADVLGAPSDPLYHGWSVAWGLEITRLLNIKLVVYKYAYPSQAVFQLPFYQFSFNYSLE